MSLELRHRCATLTYGPRTTSPIGLVPRHAATVVVVQSPVEGKPMFRASAVRHGERMLGTSTPRGAGHSEVGGPGRRKWGSFDLSPHLVTNGASNTRDLTTGFNSYPAQ
jgi:hypothetical protein